ncbi:heavy-metal-associated domain-containing protein [Fundicoccus sp. Sow4_D5]|uniref:heavy-metal-associated domain-containing protein n=1 Tax=unclassified Fundicoccus TaxID=2761543 RepID=UPI003F8E19D0
MKKELYTVEGMSCQGCANAVTRVLNDVVGVESATVDLDKQSAEVVYDEAATNFEGIRSVVDEAGYRLVK